MTRPLGKFEGTDQPSEFSGSPSKARKARTRSAADQLRNLRRTGDPDQASNNDDAADAYWEGLNP